MKIVALTSIPLGMPCLSLLEPRLRHGRQHACLSLLHQVFSFRFVAGSSSSSSLNCSSRRESASVYPNYLRSHVFVSQRPYVAEPEAPYLIFDRLHVPKRNVPLSAVSSIPLNFSRLPQTSLHPLPLGHTKSPIPC